MTAPAPDPSENPGPPTATELVPRWLRSALYVVGTFAGAACPVLITTGQSAAGAWAGALAGACNLLAVGYRPTR